MATKQKPNARGLLFGLIVGLVVITPTAGYSTPLMALLLGFIEVQSIIGYDDATDVFGIHGVAGILGTILTGIVANSALSGTGYQSGITLWGQVGLQLLAVLTVLMWSGCCTFVILWVLKKTIGLRVGKEVEIEGLDYHQHGESV